MPDAAEGVSARRQRPAKHLFAATILTLEAFVVFFASLVAFGLRLGEPGAIAAIGGGVALTALLAAGLLGRGVGYLLGWVVQVWLLLSGLLIPAMFVVGGVFALLWFVGLRVGGRIDRERAEREASR